MQKEFSKSTGWLLCKTMISEILTFWAAAGEKKKKRPVRLSVDIKSNMKLCSTRSCCLLHIYKSACLAIFCICTPVSFSPIILAEVKTSKIFGMVIRGSIEVWRSC